MRILGRRKIESLSEMNSRTSSKLIGGGALAAGLGAGYIGMRIRAKVNRNQEKRIAKYQADYEKEAREKLEKEKK